MKKSNIKILSFVPSIFMAILIYWFSAQTALVSSSLSSGITLNLIRLFNNIFHLNLSDPQILVVLEQVHGLIRKVAHFSEYYLFALSVFLPFYVYGKRNKKYYLVTILICCLYACSDELHQMFSDGRACQLRDIVIDTFGGSCAMLTLFIIRSFKK